MAGKHIPLRLGHRREIGALALILILLGTALAYQPGLHGPFLFDDLHNIRDNDAIAIHRLDLHSLTAAALSRGRGVSARPLSMVSFALNYYAGGFATFNYKLTNLVIHLLTGVCLLILGRQILKAYRARWQPLLTDGHIRLLGFTVAAAWLVHPLNLSSVLYVVQRMNELAALLSCAGLILYLWGRTRLDRGLAGPAAVVGSLAVFTPLALLAKENGALLPLYAFIIEICIFRFRTAAPGRRYLLAATFGLFLAVPLSAFFIYISVHPQWLMQGYVNRGFDLPQRLLTEARAVWYYLSLIFVPDIRRMGLYHDDFALSQGLLVPWTTLPAVLGIAGLLALSVLWRRRAPLAAMGILFYLGGLSMESSIIPLEPVFEHRNYLPMFGVLLPAFYYLTHPRLRAGRPARLRWAAALGAVAALTFATTLRAHQWGDALLFSRMEVAHHPHSPRANYGLGREYYFRVQDGGPDRKQAFLEARRYFAEATLVDPYFTNGLFGMLMLYQLEHALPPPQLNKMLADRLAHEPFANNDGNMLSQLMSCQEQRECRLPPAVLSGLLQAALRNPTLTGVNRASVLTTASRFFALADNYAMALRLARQAAAADPGELQYRLNALHWLISLGRIDEAQRALARVKAADRLGRYSDYIQDQERRLRDARLVQQMNK